MKNTGNTVGKSILKLLFCMLTIAAYPQARMNKISVNPIQLLGYNRLNIEYERGFSDGKYGIALYIGSTGNASRKIHNEYSRLSEQQVAFRWYANRLDNPCFWLGGMLSVTSGSIISDNKNNCLENMGALGLLCTGGYQFFLRSFYFNLYTAAGYSVTNNLFGSAQLTGTMNNPTDWLFAYGVKMGYVF
jgi:hypothetical protein